MRRKDKLLRTVVFLLLQLFAFEALVRATDTASIELQYLRESVQKVIIAIDEGEVHSLRETLDAYLSQELEGNPGGQHMQHLHALHKRLRNLEENRRRGRDAEVADDGVRLKEVVGRQGHVLTNNIPANPKTE